MSRCAARLDRRCPTHRLATLAALLAPLPAWREPFELWASVAGNALVGLTADMAEEAGRKEVE